jgi:hypothetical protein
MTIDEINEKLKKEGAIYYHDAWHRGYVSRKGDGYLEQYDGRYGKGYIWHHPTYKSTFYHPVSYHIIQKKGSC